MKWLDSLIDRLLPSLAAKARRMIRRELQKEFQQSLVTHASARQSLDLYEMKLETLDTRVAKRIIALEARIAELEAAQKVDRRASFPEQMRKAG